MVDKDNDKSEYGLGSRVKRIISPTITLATFITILFGGFFWLENHYASASELAQLEQRFEIKIRSDSLRETNARIWQLEERLQENPNDITAKEDLKKLKEDKNKTQKELDALQPH